MTADPASRIAVPDGCPCDFRIAVAGVPPSVEPCRVCRRELGAWLSCPHMRDRPIWTEGVCGDGAVLLRDGQPVPISEVLAILNGRK